MAVVENVESKMGSSDLDSSIQTQESKSITNTQQGQGDDETDLKSEEEVSKVVNGNSHQTQMQMDHHNNRVVVNGGFHFSRENGNIRNEGFKRDMKELEDLLSKLNPMAEEFVPVSAINGFNHGVAFFGYPNGFVMSPNSGDVRRHFDGLQKKNGYNQGKRRMNNRTSMAQHEEVIRRTVYISDIDNQITEEQLAGLFLNCGQVVDCRICGDPNSVLRFAFLEFTDEGLTHLVLPFAHFSMVFQSEDEREMCIRTIYCTNIDKKITQNEVKQFFEAYCGEVHRLRLLGDYHHSTRIAFVEFVTAESAIAALNCSGSVLGSLPIRVSPSKTPVRPRAPRPSMH
ncbi:hypothetical protein QQ045_026376 [Rhodiola kirilowii]